MENAIHAGYGCAQKDLYSVLETAWGNCGLRLAEFAGMKSLYTAELVEAERAAIVAARSMPGPEVARGKAEMLRLELVRKGRVCLRLFQFLKAYIDGAWVETAERRVQYGAAGLGYYRAASRQDWESMVGLNGSANGFLSVAEHVAAMVDVAGMPIGFVEEYVVASGELDGVYAAYKLAKQTSVSTAAKVRANNGIFRRGMAMLRDGQKIFGEDVAVKIQFVFARLLALIRPAEAGVQGQVQDAETLAGVEDAVVMVQREGYPAEHISVDAEGRFSRRLAAGRYVIRFLAEGYVEQVVKVRLRLRGLKWYVVELGRER